MFDIPVGFASVFFMILVGYFVLTVWFGGASGPVVVKKANPQLPEKASSSSPELNAG